MIRNEIVAMDWIELNPGSFFLKNFLWEWEDSRIKEQWETLQDNTLQPVFPETSFFENMMGDLKWVFIKCKSVNRCFFLFLSAPFQRKYVFGHPQESVGTMNWWTTPPNRKAKPMLPEVAGEWFFSGLAWGVKMSWTTERLSSRRTNFLPLLCGKKPCGNNLCWSLKCFEHHVFWGDTVGWGEGMAQFFWPF